MNIEKLKTLLAQLDYNKNINNIDKVKELENEIKSFKLDFIKSDLIKFKSDSKSKYITYPDYSDPDFYKKLLNKKEFIKFKDEINKNVGCDNTVFSLTKNQKFVKNFIHPSTPYNSILLFHDVGVGKTLTAVSIAEQFINSLRKKIIVITPANLKENFKKQIFNIKRLDQPISKSYYDQVNDPSLKEEMIEKKGNKLVKSKYEFFSFQEFANYVENEKKSVKKEGMRAWHLTELFSNTVIIIDEVHNLRDDMILEMKDDDMKKSSKAIMEIMQYSLNTKLILLTATPMFNEAKEIIWLLNVMLTNDKRTNISESDIFDNNAIKKDNLKTIARGYISRVRGRNPITFPIRLQPSHSKIKILTAKDIPTIEFNKTTKIQKNLLLSKLELIPSNFTDYQKHIYNLCKKDNNKMNERTLTQISILVFPFLNKNDINKTNYAECYGKKGFDNLINTNVKKSNSMLHSYKTEKQFLDENNIEIYAPKLKSIIDLINSSKGIVYIYSFFLPSGLLPLAIALEHAGYNKYDTNNLLVDKKRNKKVKGNYVIISGDSQYTRSIDDCVSEVCSPENKNGKKIKVVLGSSASAEGLDFKNIREVHFLEPWYHLNKVEQVIGRAARHCSHINLEEKERNVTVYHHITKDSLSKEESIDEKTYRIAENKQKLIDEVEKILEEVSIDCTFIDDYSKMYIEKNKIIESSQKVLINSNTIKDIVKPVPKCVYNKTDETIDSSTYGIHFMEYDIEQTIKELQNLFSKNGVLTYKQILDNLQQNNKIDVDVINYAISRILDEKILINNNNIDGYLIYRSDKYMFQPNSISEVSLKSKDRVNYQPKITKCINFKVDDTSKLSNSNVNVNVGTSTSKNTILNTLIDQIKTLQKQIKYIELQDVIIDYYIDRINQKDINSLCKHVLNSLMNKNDKNYLYYEKIRKSLVEAHILSEDNRYILNIYKNDELDKLKEIYVIDKSNVKNINIRKANNSDKYDFKDFEFKDENNSIKAFMEISKSSTVTFKIKDLESANQKGIVCKSLYKQKIINLLKEIKPDIEVNEKDNKDKLCELYELFVRYENNKDKKLKIFLRIYEAKLQKNLLKTK